MLTGTSSACAIRSTERDARSRQAALELAQERMRQAGLAAEGLQREPAVAPQLAHACAEAGRSVRGLLAVA